MLRYLLILIDLLTKLTFKLYIGYIWAEDKEHCEEYGRMLNADSSKVSMRAKKRGLPQVGSYEFIFSIYISKHF